MIHKYQISRDPKAGRMTIREFAVVERNSARKETGSMTAADFALLSEQRYRLAALDAAVARGREDVICELRSADFFPVRSCIEQIADSVLALCAEEADGPAVVVFDDCQAMGAEAGIDDDGGAAH